MSLLSFRFFRRVLYSGNAYYSNYLYHLVPNAKKIKVKNMDKRFFHEKFGIICAEA